MTGTSTGVYIHGVVLPVIPLMLIVNKKKSGVLSVEPPARFENTIGIRFFMEI